MTVVWIMGTVAACVTIIGGFTAIAYTDSIQTSLTLEDFERMSRTSLDPHSKSQ